MRSAVRTVSDTLHTPNRRRRSAPNAASALASSDATTHTSGTAMTSPSRTLRAFFDPPRRSAAAWRNGSGRCVMIRPTSRKPPDTTRPNRHERMSAKAFISQRSSARNIPKKLTSCVMALDVQKTETPSRSSETAQKVSRFRSRIPSLPSASSVAPSIAAASSAALSPSA